MNVRDQILASVVEHFVSSSDFNGILASRLPALVAFPWKDVRTGLFSLVESGQIAMAFDRIQGNPHILGIPPPSTDRQRELLASEAPHTFCVYPTRRSLVSRPDLASFADRPFTQRLALGDPQLTPAFSSLYVSCGTHSCPIEQRETAITRLSGSRDLAELDVSFRVEVGVLFTKGAPTDSLREKIDLHRDELVAWLGDA